MYINKFIPICVLSLKTSKLINYKIIHSIATPIKFIIISEGSHTRLINYKKKDTTKLQVFQYQEHKIHKPKRKIRYVWLETSIYTKMTFARSLWKIKQEDMDIQKINRQSPIGNSFINNKIDINKNIIELQYCYCKNFEKSIKSKEIILGKKYELNYNNKSNIIIQEFFSLNIFI
uniref:Uncharacterized protein n=1 Tax=Herposiphonia versicolor TaxID=2007163 RepID=A0A1Z1MF61_9FLOR|nr:hypothetical protein [Herposiphonia versicolor]ARW64717.1 hypothetical protein [Herposiphonia versicolor]